MLTYTTLMAIFQLNMILKSPKCHMCQFFQKYSFKPQLTGEDRPDVQEQPGSEQLMKTSTFSPRTLEFTLPRGRPRI